MKFPKIAMVIAGLVFAFGATNSAAQTWWSTSVTGYVTMIDATGFGARQDDGYGWAPIVFTITTAIPGNPCATPTGSVSQLVYFATPFDNSGTVPDLAHPTGNDRRLANARVQLSQLQLALASGLPVKVIGYLGSGGFCQVVSVQLLSY